MLISPSEGITAERRGRISTILQNEAADCSLACLAMIASSFGHEISLTEMRRRYSVSAKGLGLKAMMTIADSLGLAARPVRLEFDELPDLKTPAVLHWNFNHFVVLEKTRKHAILIHDPARGKRWIDRAEADRSFTGVALEFTATAALEARTIADRVRLGDLFNRARGLVPSLVQMFVLAAIMQLFALASPILNQFIVDEAISKGDANLVTVLAGGMLVLLLITTGVRALQGLVGLYVGTQMSFQLRTNLLRHALRLPVAWFEKRHIGDILSRFSSLRPVQDVLLNSITAVVLNALIGLTAMIMMAIYSPMLTAVQLFCTLILLGVRLASFPYFRRLTSEGLHLDAKVQTTFLETIRGARSFKLFGQEQDRVAIWQNEQARLINNQVQLARFGLLGGAGTSLLGGIQLILVWLLGAQMVIRGELSLGMLFAFQAYTTQFSGAMATLITQAFTIRTMRIHLERLADIVHADAEPGLDVPVEPGRAFRGAISFSNVSFRYADHEPWILDKVDLDVAPGEFICLQGPSGQGKTTLLKLILGFEDPQKGKILVDGVELRHFGIRTLRSHIGVVMQDDQLFAGTIADNISFFDMEADMERVEEAARQACIHDEIMSLPMGYRTFTGDLGSALSGGQRQRVLLARALYRRPRILVLDEGTANLDAATEKSIMDTIARLEITRIVVAHRPGASVGATRFYSVAGQKVELR